MNFFARMSISSRITVILAAALLLLTLTISSIYFTAKLGEAFMHATKRISVAVAVFADDLQDQSDAFMRGTAGSDTITRLVRTSEEFIASDAQADRLSSLTNADLTYFQLNRAAGQFEHVMTSVRRPDGSRAAGALLDASDDAHAALLAGRSFVGETDILGVDYLTIYEPVWNAQGEVVGAVSAATLQDNVYESVVVLGLKLLLPVSVTLALAVLLGQIFLKRQMIPLRALVTVVARLSRRDFEAEIAESKSQDEIGELTRACSALRNELIEGARLAEAAAGQEAEREHLRMELSRVVDDLRDGLSRLAEGDLTSPIPNNSDNPFPAEYDPLRQSYNAVIERLSEVIEQVNGIAQNVRDSAAEIAGASRELSSRAETQAATLEQSAAALTELTESVSSTAERAGKAQEASFGNKTGAERGAQVVREAVTAMQDIERGSDQITRIISVIEDIAFQTNLLALNAGVEAARAGDAGRGFAVVASEVRLLAQRASESAREIKALISDSTQQVGQGSALVRRTGESLADILERANEAASLVTDIALAAAEQARGLAEVNTGVNQLDHVTQQNTAVAEETSAAAVTLKSRSEELIVALSGFRTRQTRSASSRFSAEPSPEGRKATVEASVVDWAPAVAAAASSPRANKTRQNGSWAEF